MTTPSSERPMQLVLVTGMSGSGKSVALRALEDAGFYCVDNLPPELLMGLVDVERRHHAHRLAVAMDARSVGSLPGIPSALDAMRAQAIDIQVIFLDASNETLVHRFSETRRRHPLSARGEADQSRALIAAIALERELLSPLREIGHVIDTSVMRSAQLQSAVKSVSQATGGQVTLVFESFSFKRGPPMDADYVFDVRMLPNPHYEPELRTLTGLDEPVASFLAQKPEVLEMQRHITEFLKRWLPDLQRDHRAYVTVAIGCTGGQHRSVYLVEQLADAFAQAWKPIRRHREIAVRELGSTRW